MPYYSKINASHFGIFFIHFKHESKYFSGFVAPWTSCVLAGTWLICQWINFKRTIKCLWIFRVDYNNFFPKSSSTILLSISEAMTVFWILADPYGRRRWAFMLFCSLLLEAQASLKWENSASVRLSLNVQFCGLFCFWRHKQLHCFVSHNGFTWAVPACDCLISSFKTP